MRIGGTITQDGIIRPSSYDLDRFVQWCEKNGGKFVWIDIKKDRKTRSNNQNNYYWGVIVAMCADYFGYTPEEMHEELKYKFLRTEEPGKPGRTRSTADMSTEETEKYYNDIRIWMAVEYGFIVPLPNEKEAEND